ncbi:HtaA domain-containing protein [Streptomyces sp. NPDC050560]|uniref:HtaA domain-containing protein n=1 Tax=Streptomyces sp. NPDC050560 TaxID=3365630 RepID=UPI00378D2C79
MAPIHRSLALAAAVAVTVGAGALALPATVAAAAPAAPAASIGLEDGTLEWGFKESFRSYLLSPIANGSITVADGAEQAPDNGPFTFTGGTGDYDTTDHAVNTAFQGSVHFLGHEGVLDIELADLRVSTTGTTGTITADVTTTTDGTATTDDDTPLADLDLSDVAPGSGDGGAMVFADIPATLTAEGADAFQGFYTEGTALDPATLAVTPAQEGSTGGSGNGGSDNGGTGSGGSDGGGQAGGGSDTGGTGGTGDSGGTGGTGGTGGDQPADESGKIYDGALSWGLKESFRAYIKTGGDITVGDGASDNGDGFDFPYATGTLDADAKKLTAAFDGTARFTYPAHGIDMTFGAPEIEAEGAKGTLKLDVTTPEGTDKGVEFATLDLGKASYEADGDVLLLDKVPAALTAAGAAEFTNDTTGSPYPEGTALDPVTVALTLSADADVPGGSGGSATGGASGGSATGGGGGTAGGGTGALASTGTGMPAAGIAGAAAAVTAVGAGAFWLARRQAPARA